MDATSIRSHRRFLLRVAAGLEVGVSGGLVMLGWLLAGSFWSGLPWWTAPNLLASTLYGEAALRAGPGMPAVAGIALLVTTAGLIGAVYGALIPESITALRCVLFGLLTGLLWYYVASAWGWRKLNPLVPLYESRPAMYVAHVLYGVALAFHRRALASLRRVYLEEDTSRSADSRPPAL